MNASSVFKLLAFFLILAILFAVGHYVRKWLGAGFSLLRNNSLVGRFFGNRTIDTQTEGRIFEVTQVSVPDYVLLWLWVPAFVRMYLWRAVDVSVSYFDYRLSQLPIDPWNQFGVVPKAIVQQIDRFLGAIDRAANVWVGVPYIIASLLTAYVSFRVYKTVRVEFGRLLYSALFAAGLVVLGLYTFGFLLGGVFIGLNKLGAGVETIHLVHPWNLPGILRDGFVEAPIRTSIWILFGWWLTMWLHASIWSRLQYNPTTKELRRLSWDGTESTLLNHVINPERILSVVSETGESQPVEAADKKATGKRSKFDRVDDKKRVNIRWAYCGWIHFIFLFGGMRFKDEVTGSKEESIVDVRGLPFLYGMIRRFTRYNTVPASDQIISPTAQAARNSRLKARAIAGRMGRGALAGIRRAASFPFRMRAARAAAKAAASASVAASVASPTVETAPAVATVAVSPPVAKQA